MKGYSVTFDLTQGFEMERNQEFFQPKRKIRGKKYKWDLLILRQDEMKRNDSMGFFFKMPLFLCMYCLCKFCFQPARRVARFFLVQHT
jgi:hypothetical protein